MPWSNTNRKFNVASSALPLDLTLGDMKSHIQGHSDAQGVYLELGYMLY